MSQIFADMKSIFMSLLSNDAWEVSQAFQLDAIWIVGVIALVIGAVAFVALFKWVPLVDRYLERSIMVWSYLIIAGIIFVEVIRRFVFNEQAPWSTTLPPFLFLIMTWFGCSYNIRKRTHLAFSEFRMNFPPILQMACLLLDAVLWWGFCLVVLVTSAKVTANSAGNFQILLGTDNVLQWWFLITVPVAFTVMAARVLENLLEDFSNLRASEPLVQPASITG